MYNKKLYCIFFFILCFVINLDNVLGLTCKYNSSGYSNDEIKYTVTISSTKADAVEHRDGFLQSDKTYKIKNWNKNSEDYWNGKVSYEASKEYSDTCPPYLFHRYVFGEWSTYYLINNASASQWEKELTPALGKFEKFVYVDEDDETDYEDTLICSYDAFNVTYTKDGKALRVEKNEDSDLYESPPNDTVVLSQELQSMYSNWNGSCPTVCYTKGVGDCTHGHGGMAHCFAEYTIYYSAADTNNQACEVVNCKAGTDNCVADESGNTYNGICSGYDSYISSIESSYQNFKSCNEGDGECQGSNINLANQNILKIESFCSSVYKIAYYSDPCVKACTMFDTQLSQLKSTYGIGVGDGGGTASCSLSERVVGWIFKIIKWIRYLVPILLILLSILDFIKAIASNSEDEMRKVGAKFVKRLIVAALIFLLPLLLEFLLGIFNIETKDYCLNVN